MSSFCGVSDDPVLDFCWCLLLTSQGWIEQPYSHLVEVYALHVRWNSPLVWHQLTSWWPAWQPSWSHPRTCKVLVGLETGTHHATGLTVQTVTVCRLGSHVDFLRWCRADHTFILSYFLCYRFRIFLLDGYFREFHTRPAGWTHIVLNYIGPNDGEGIRVYYDRQEVVSDTTKSRGLFDPADGSILVAKRADGDYGYTSLQMDELIFFNKTLSTTDITAMYNAV